MSCISMDFNANYYWDEYINNCGVVLSLTYVFTNGAIGIIGHLASGNPQGSGRSHEEYLAAGGNSSLYVCPVDSHQLMPTATAF